MSLTSFLRNKDERCIKFQEEIKKITPSKKSFKSLDNDYVAFDTKRDLKVPYYLSSPSEATLLGVEFDYLARFRIAQIVEGSRNVVLDIVAENFFESHSFKNSLPKDVFNKLHKKYFKIKRNIEAYIRDKKRINEKMIEDVFLLALLEQSWRGGALPQDINRPFRKPSDQFKIELREIVNVFEINFIRKVVKPNSIVKYNPSFGDCSVAIGGADADIYIDGTLYDFKCTKNIGYKSKDAQQIVGYYILDEIARRRKNSRKQQSLISERIERVAIYSARAGGIYYYDVNDLGQEEIKAVILEVEKILFYHKDVIPIRNEKSVGINKKKTKKGKKKQGKYTKNIIVALISTALVIKGVSFIENKKDLVRAKGNEAISESVKNDSKREVEEEKNNKKENFNKDEKYVVKDSINKEEANKVMINEKRVIDFNNYEKDIEGVLLKRDGFYYRYYSAVLSKLRSYDIGNVDDAYTVYKLSDKLLNEMYGEFKVNYGKERFEKLKSAQIK